MTQPIDPINYWIISGSKYGSRIFVFEGKGYCLDKKYAENNILGNRKTLHLRCKNRGCRARGKIVEGWFSRKAGEDHTCQTKSEKLLVEDLKTKMKKRAKTEATRLQVIYHEVLIGAPPVAKRAINFNRFKASLVRARASVIPKAPKTFLEAAKKFEINFYPPRFQNFYKGYVSVRAQGIEYPAIIFADQSLVEKVSNECTTCFVAANFSTAPQKGPEDLFIQRQVQVINVVAQFQGLDPLPNFFQDGIIPVIHVVLVSRNMSLYKKAFEKVCSLFKLFRPSTIVTNWELALRKSLMTAFEDARLNSCRLQYAKSLYAKIIRKYGLLRYYHAGSAASAPVKELGCLLRQFMLLPLLQPSDIRLQVARLVDGLKNLEVGPDLKKKLRNFANFVVGYWCRTIGWKNLTVAGVRNKTTNIVERFNGFLAQSIPTHLSFFNFLDAMLSNVVEAAKVKVQQKSKVSFLAPDNRSKDEKENEQKIEKLENEYLSEQMDSTSYLEHLVGIYDYFDPSVLDGHVDEEEMELLMRIEAEEAAAIAAAAGEDLSHDDEELEEPVIDEADMWPAQLQDWGEGPEAQQILDPDQAVITCPLCCFEVKALYVHSECSHVQCHYCMTRWSSCALCRVDFRQGYLRKLNFNFDLAKRKDAGPSSSSSCPQLPVPEGLQTEFTWENYNRHMRRVCPGHYEDISDDELDPNDRSNDIPPGDDDLYTFPGTPDTVLLNSDDELPTESPSSQDTSDSSSSSFNFESIRRRHGISSSSSERTSDGSTTTTFSYETASGLEESSTSSSQPDSQAGLEEVTRSTLLRPAIFRPETQTIVRPGRPSSLTLSARLSRALAQSGAVPAVAATQAAAEAATEPVGQSNISEAEEPASQPASEPHRGRGTPHGLGNNAE